MINTKRLTVANFFAQVLRDEFNHVQVRNVRYYNCTTHYRVQLRIYIILISANDPLKLSMRSPEP